MSYESYKMVSGDPSGENGENPFIDDEEEEEVERHGRGLPKPNVETRTSGEVGPEQMMLTTYGIYLWGELFVGEQNADQKLNPFGEF